MNEAVTPFVIEPEWALSQRVRVASSTRSGGSSSWPYGSLNLGLHVGDDEASVRGNRVWLSEQLQLPCEPHWLNKEHGSRVCRLSDELSDGIANERVAGADNTADASWTNTSRVVAVMTADCLPVVIANEDETAVAVAHAGWRGLVGGVLSAAVREFAPSDKLHAWLGPAIGPEKFEVGEEVLKAFVSRNASNRSAFVAGVRPDKYLADIYKLARNELASIGDITVTGGDHCTVSDASKFFSYRRDGARSGRMATLAWLA